MARIDTTEEGNAASRQKLISAIRGSALAEQVVPETVQRAVMFKPAEGKGNTYRIIVTNEMDPYDHPVAPQLMFATTARTLAIIGDDYQGTKRKAAKISIANAAIEDFADLTDLIATLPTEAAMVNHVPTIKEGATSDRVTEEERRVRLRVWIYAASRESDNDFHLIVGRDPALPAGQPRVYMTMELSGLPPATSGSYATLKTVRDTYKGFFGNYLPGTTYHFYAEPHRQFPKPIPVEITGSLYFDIVHSKLKHPRSKQPGPPELRPFMPVIWEVHPISNIVFEP